MAILRDILSPTVGAPQFAVASRRRRMTDPNFYDEQEQQQQAGTPVSNNLFEQLNNKIADQSLTGGNFSASVDRLAGMAAPPSLEPSARVRQADMSMVQPDNFKSFYEMLGSINQRGDEMLGAAKAQAAHRRQQEQQRLMQQQIAGFQLPNLQVNGGGSYKGGGSNPPGKGVQRWAGMTLQVMKELNIPEQYLGMILKRMNQESGGNPNAYNGWDINAKRGIPSQGLMQTVPPTFKQYAGPYVGRGIMDPYANIYAGLNYAMTKYGRRFGGDRLAGLRQAMTQSGGY